jgi:hypothetical protein
MHSLYTGVVGKFEGRGEEGNGKVRGKGDPRGLLLRSAEKLWIQAVY